MVTSLLFLFCFVQYVSVCSQLMKMIAAAMAAKPPSLEALFESESNNAYAKTGSGKTMNSPA